MVCGDGSVAVLSGGSLYLPVFDQWERQESWTSQMVGVRQRSAAICMTSVTSPQKVSCGMNLQLKIEPLLLVDISCHYSSSMFFSRVIKFGQWPSERQRLQAFPSRGAASMHVMNLHESSQDTHSQAGNVCATWTLLETLYTHGDIVGLCRKL
eukprot:6314806-Amphidinium_carterae.1